MAIPRLVQVTAGVVLLAWSGLSFVGAFAIIQMVPVRSPVLTKMIGILLACGSAWGVVKAIALVRGPSSSGGHLLSPITFYALGIVLALMPAYALLSGAVRSWATLAQTVFALFVAYRIFRAGSTPNDDHDDFGAA